MTEPRRRRRFVGAAAAVLLPIGVGAGLAAASGSGSGSAVAPAGAADPVLDNPWASVHRGASPCADAGPGCGDRVVVSFGEVEVTPGRGAAKRLAYGEALVLPAGETYRVRGDDWAEVNVKTDRPPPAAPAETIPAGKNRRLHTGDGYFLFEERLEPGDTRERHSHAARVVLVLGATELQQWPDGAEEVFKTQVPGTIKFNPPVIHLVKNIGDAPLRNLVLEFIP